MPPAGIQSILAADFGSANTRALLFDVVEGEYRLVAQSQAPSTLSPAANDAHTGFAAAVQDIASATGRQFFDDSNHLIRPEQSERVGVDYALTTTSAGPPLRAALLGLYLQRSLAAVKRALALFYVDVVAELHLEDGLSRSARLNRLVHSRPQLIIVTGGTDGGARAILLELLALVQQAVALLPAGERPPVLYAGNSAVAPAAREMLSHELELVISPNIRQDSAALQAALGQVFDAQKRRGSGSFQRVAMQSDSGLLPTARGLETMTAFFARARRCEVLTLDFGSARAMLSLARPGAAQTILRNDIGLGQSAARALEALGAAAVAEWLPFKPQPGELAQYTRNKGLRLGSVPQTMRERYIEYALLRAGIRFMLAELAPTKLGLVLIAGAALTGSGQGALDMLLLADALQSDGIVQVKADPYGALAALGALAPVAPSAVVQLANSNVLKNVGSLIRVSGQAPAGATALKISGKLASGASIAETLAVGEVWHLPLPAAGAVELRLQLPRGLSIGGKRRLRLHLTGGRGGLLFDARLNPQPTGTTTERAVNMLRWFAAVSGQAAPVAIPEAWLSPGAADNPLV